MRILHPAHQTILRFFHPSLIDRLKTIRFGQNLCCIQTDCDKLVIRKITSTPSKIGAGVAQDVDQLKSHAVAAAQCEHLVLSQTGEVLNMPETKSRPEFAHTACNQIGVFVQVGSSLERANLCRVMEPVQIKHLAMRDLL